VRFGGKISGQRAVLLAGIPRSKEDIVGDEREKETEEQDVTAHYKPRKANEEPTAEGDEDAPDVEAHIKPKK
jgi:hypothetical protein